MSEVPLHLTYKNANVYFFQDKLALNDSQREQTGGYDPPEVDAATIPEKGREAVLLCISEFPRKSLHSWMVLVI